MPGSQKPVTRLRPGQFSTKAGIYDRYRWSYDPAAIDALGDIAGLTGRETIVDIGAGTGLLTRHLARTFSRVIAIDPDAAMLGHAGAVAAEYSHVERILALAERTGLADHSVDVIAVGRALHWFEPHAARREMLRILRPPRWLAVFSVPCLDKMLIAAVRGTQTVDNGWEVTVDKFQTGRHAMSPQDYFGDARYRRLQFPRMIRESWTDFLGRICSLSPAPGREHPRYAHLEAALREVFDCFSVDGMLHVPIATELLVGTMDPP